MMSGLPGTGKSTVANRLAEQVDGAIVVATDVVRKELFPVPTYADEENGATYRAVQQRLLDLLGAGSIAIFDATNLRAQYRAWADLAQAQTGCKLLIVQTISAETITKQRLERRNAQGNDASDADYEIYKQLEETVEPINRPHLTIRTDTHYEADFARAVDAVQSLAKIAP